MEHDVDLDLGLLFKYILKKWYIIVIIAIAGCLVASFVCTKKNVKTTKSEPETIIDVASIREGLTEEEATQVEKLADLEEYRQTSFNKVQFSDSESVEHLYYINNLYATTYASLTESQKKYYDALVPQEEEEEEEEGGNSLIKWALIGLLAGGFIGLLIVAIPYIMSDKIRTKSDLFQAYGLLDLDSIENAMQVVEKRSYKAVCLLGDPIANCNYSFSSVMNADSVILSYTIDKTTFDRIDKDIFTAQQYGLPIIGYIVK